MIEYFVQHSFIVKALERVIEKWNESTEVNVVSKVNNTRNIIVPTFVKGYVIVRMWTDKKTK